MDKKETDRLYYLEHKEELKEKRRLRYQRNKEKELQSIKKYAEEHKDEIAEWQKQYRLNNADKLKKYKEEYYGKMYGRALRLAYHYKSEDEKHNRGESTLTPEWIIENIFSGQKCHYCEESDWKKLGADRINNDLPHTPDNVVPCCFECNKKRGTKSYEEFMKMLGKKP